MRPVAEFQFMDFIGCAFNQISNMVAKTHYLWGAPAPLVLRGLAADTFTAARFTRRIQRCGLSTIPD